jgi:hypothetical protein
VGWAEDSIGRLKWQLTAIVLSATAVVSMGHAFGTNVEPQPAALPVITDTADKICGIVSAAGSYQSSKVSGDIDVELNGLFKRLADLGVKFSASTESSGYQGVLQQDLASTLKDNAQCKLKVFESLKDLIVSNPNSIFHPKIFNAKN